VTRWSRIAAVCLVIGGVGYLGKYILLAVLDPHGTSISRGLQVVTGVGLILGEFLIPIGVTAVPARWLAGKSWLLIASGFFLAILGVFLVAKGLDAAFASIVGDPLRLRTEGTLGVLGAAACLVGLALLYRKRRAPGRSGY
jgi:hypothetical protein